MLIFVDNKAKIPVGEPGTPKPATSHMRKAVTTKNVTLKIQSLLLFTYLFPGHV